MLFLIEDTLQTIYGCIRFKIRSSTSLPKSDIEQFFDISSANNIAAIVGRRRFENHL